MAPARSGPGVPTSMDRWEPIHADRRSRAGMREPRTNVSGSLGTDSCDTCPEAYAFLAAPRSFTPVQLNGLPAVTAILFICVPLAGNNASLPYRAACSNAEEGVHWGLLIVGFRWSWQDARRERRSGAR